MTPRVEYTFAVGGLFFTGESRVPKQIWPGLREGGSLPVRFLPGSPAANHPAAWEAPALRAWGPLIIPIVPAAFGILLLAQLRGQRRLAAQGLPATAVITKCGRGSKGGFWVEYEFQTADGSSAKGRGWPDCHMEVGATIVVLYLPQKPRLNQPYPMSYYRVVESAPMKT